MIDKNSPIDNLVFSVIDVETTGLNPVFNNRICEIAVLRTTITKEEGSFHSLIDPERAIPPEITCISGINDNMLENAPLFKDIADKMLVLIKDSVLVFHNASFDLSFIFAELRKQKLSRFDNFVIDTLLIARRNFSFQSNTLLNIAKTLDITIEREHRAMDDVMITKQILHHMIIKLKEKGAETLSDIIELQGGPIIIEDPKPAKVPGILQEAMKMDYNLKIKYVSRDGYESIREVKPLEAIMYNDSVYLNVFCYIMNDQRILKLDRIKNMTLVKSIERL